MHHYERNNTDLLSCIQDFDGKHHNHGMILLKLLQEGQNSGLPDRPTADKRHPTHAQQLKEVHDNQHNTYHPPINGQSIDNDNADDLYINRITTNIQGDRYCPPSPLLSRVMATIETQIICLYWEELPPTSLQIIQ